MIRPNSPKRPHLTAVPLASVWPPPPPRPGATFLYVTMSPGQWDTLLQAAYDQGCVLIEVNRHERPVRAYRRVQPARATG